MLITLLIFSCFTVFTVCSFLFLLVVYIKEFNRDDATFQKLVDLQEQQIKATKDMPVYILAQRPASQETKPVEKSNKIIN